MLAPEKRQNLLEALSRGEKQQVTIMRSDGSVNLFAEVNPQFKTVNVYDEHGKKLTISQALGEKSESKQNQQLLPEKKISIQKSRRNSDTV